MQLFDYWITFWLEKGKRGYTTIYIKRDSQREIKELDSKQMWFSWWWTVWYYSFVTLLWEESAKTKKKF